MESFQISDKKIVVELIKEIFFKIIKRTANIAKRAIRCSLSIGDRKEDIIPNIKRKGAINLSGANTPEYSATSQLNGKSKSQI